MLRESSLTSSDSLSLYFWTLPHPQPKAVIAHIHGMGEHSRRYDHLAEFWSRAGYAVAGFDWRGHGRSQGQRGHTPSLAHLLDDLDVYLNAVRRAFPGLPVLLYGHSMGGNLALNYVLRRQPDIVAVVASAPYLQLAFTPPAWKVLLAGWLRHLYPTLTQRTGLNLTHLAHDPEVAQTYTRDPLNHGKITVSFFSEVHAAGAWAIDHAAELHVPALLLHGDADRITSAAGSRAFVDRAQGNATLQVWPGFFHELHNEAEWTRVAEYTREWMDQQLSTRHPI